MTQNTTALIAAASQAAVTQDLAQQVLSLIDLTSLNTTDTDEIITQLCARSNTPLGKVAAICIYPRFIPVAKKALQKNPVKIATVVNFPEGNSSLDSTISAIKKSMTQGADEIDVVLPYHAYLAGQRQFARDYISACKTACGEHILLKVILETGALTEPAIIASASEDAIISGADFIKTSTGKLTIGATLEAASIMLQVIHAANHKGRHVGFKAAGGIRTITQAASYLYLANEIMGPNWVTAKTFRFGASSLLDDILGTATKNPAVSTY